MRKLPIMVVRAFVIPLCLCLTHTQSHGQSKRASFETNAAIQWAGVDRPGDLFLVLETGEIQKYDKRGNKLGSHSFGAAPRLFEPMDGVQCFYFLGDKSVYGQLSSDLSTATGHPLDPSFAIEPWLVCPSLHELWIVDRSDFTLRKTRMESATISVEVSLPHDGTKKIADYSYMREYQNYLFVLDKNSGVLLFNSLGKYIRTLGEKRINSFNFLGEELYYTKENELMLVDLFTEEKRKLALPQLCKTALLTDDTLFAIEDGRVVIYDFKP